MPSVKSHLFPRSGCIPYLRSEARREELLCPLERVLRWRTLKLELTGSSIVELIKQNADNDYEQHKKS